MSPTYFFLKVSCFLNLKQNIDKSFSSAIFSTFKLILCLNYFNEFNFKNCANNYALTCLVHFIISDAMVEFGNLVLTPLETAFGYQKGSLDKIRVDGTVNERKCAAFAQLSQLTATLPSNIPPEVSCDSHFQCFELTYV